LEETKISGKRKCGKKLSQEEKVFLVRKTNRKKPSLSRFFSTSEPTAVGDADALPSYDMGKSKIAVRELCVIHSVYSFSFKAISPTFDSKFLFYHRSGSNTSLYIQVQPKAKYNLLPAANTNCNANFAPV
jgi:hypothetical protein